MWRKKSNLDERAKIEALWGRGIRAREAWQGWHGSAKAYQIEALERAGVVGAALD